MATEDHLAIVQALLVPPFPEREVHEGDRSSGPGNHVYVLQSTQDFWDDPGVDVITAAAEEIEASLETLQALLTSLRGEPEVIDLAPYLWADDPAPEPILQLCAHSGQMTVWRSPEATSGRWAALAVAQQDAELPMELVAAIGTLPIPLPPPRSDLFPS